MPQAVVDPEELRQFARNLKKFNNDLRERSNSLAIWPKVLRARE